MRIRKDSHHTSPAISGFVSTNPVALPPMLTRRTASPHCDLAPPAICLGQDLSIMAIERTPPGSRTGQVPPASAIQLPSTRGSIDASSFTQHCLDAIEKIFARRRAPREDLPSVMKFDGKCGVLVERESLRMLVEANDADHPAARACASAMRSRRRVGARRASGDRLCRRASQAVRCRRIFRNAYRTGPVSMRTARSSASCAGRSGSAATTRPCTAWKFTGG